MIPWQNFKTLIQKISETLKHHFMLTKEWSLDWQKKNQMCLLKIRNMNCRANGYNHHCETIFNSTYKLIKMNRCMHFYIMTLKILITGTLIRFQASFLSQNVYD